jgi:nicotinate dehydrogenase subunit B
MTCIASAQISRRVFLSAGSLVVTFSLVPRALAESAGGGEGSEGPPIVAPNLVADLRSYPFLDSWIRVDADGITVFTGKAELGQGIRTALSQVAAEELDVPLQSIKLVTADTRRTPDEGVTSGSHSMQDSGMALLNAAANVRVLLIQAAAKDWGVTPDTLTTTGDGHVRSADGRIASYETIASTLFLHVEAIPNPPLRSPTAFRTMGKEVRRVDIPAKLTGGAAYVHDMRLPGMLHARVVRGPSFGTRLKTLDVASATAMPGVVTVVQKRCLHSGRG